MGIPWRVAFALQADGWYLRSDIIWAKPNPMPESVTDRPTKAHEYVFLLTKSPRYFFDQEAVREQHSPNTHSRGNGTSPKNSALVEANRTGIGSRIRPVGPRESDWRPPPPQVETLDGSDGEAPRETGRTAADESSSWRRFRSSIATASAGPTPAATSAACGRSRRNRTPKRTSRRTRRNSSDDASRQAARSGFAGRAGRRANGSGRNEARARNMRRSRLRKEETCPTGQGLTGIWEGGIRSGWTRIRSRRSAGLTAATTTTNQAQSSTRSWAAARPRS